MAPNENDNPDLEQNKALVQELAGQDGKLVAPIDLSLDITRELTLDKLKWVNLDKVPVKMKLTNTGETLIVSGKWDPVRPYLAGGPLSGNYVFSQVHFHWGSNEHEGSEHTVSGVCYPMEMHVVFYKTCYITQEAALKQDDGVIVIVYLVKLQDQTTAGLQWVSRQLHKILEPLTSTMLPPCPLSVLLMPFTRDYLLYWGSLATTRCAHTVLWLVSRGALGIRVDDLNMFRNLLNSRKEAMNKNFRNASPSDGRSIFHVNPSSETKYLLLPGVIEPPGQSLIVNYFQMEELTSAKAEQMFSKGDEGDMLLENTVQLNKESFNLKTDIICEDLSHTKVNERDTILPHEMVPVKTVPNEEISSISGKTSSTDITEKDQSTFKSKLPVRAKNNRGALKSSLAQYFQPGEASQDRNIVQSCLKNQTEKIGQRRISTIPKPLGKNAGKLEAKTDPLAKNVKTAKYPTKNLKTTIPMKSPE